MSKNSPYRPYLKRLGIIFTVCLVLVTAFTEITYRFQKDSADRTPQIVQIIIPAGTAQRVAAGEPVPSIPPGLSFVAGDVLEVINQDQTDHQLGPLWVPAGTTASLAMDVPERLTMECTFQANKVFDLEVRPVTTYGDRIKALALAVPTTTALVFLYSLAALPADGKASPKKNLQPPTAVNE
jgi:hypothetical protein